MEWSHLELLVSFCPRILSGSVTGVLMPRNTGCAYRFNLEEVPLRWCCCQRLSTLVDGTLVPPALLVLMMASQLPTHKLIMRSDRLLIWCCIVHRRPWAKRLRHVVWCIAINMPVISRLSNADVYRSIVLGTSVMPARRVEYIQVPLEKRNNSKALLSRGKKSRSACEDQ